MATKRQTQQALPTRAQEIAGPRDNPNAPAGTLRIQPGLPMGFPYFGMTILNAAFRRYDSEPDRWYVEVEATIGTVKSPYVLVLTVPQALAADIVETV